MKKKKKKKKKLLKKKSDDDNNLHSTNSGEYVFYMESELCKGAYCRK